MAFETILIKQKSVHLRINMNILRIKHQLHFANAYPRIFQVCLIRILLSKTS